MARKNIDMCHGPLGWKILRYTVPIILTGVLQLLFNAADLVVVGQYCGSNSVAAVGATGSLTNLIVNLFIGLATGSGVVVAQSIGAAHEADTQKAVHTIIPCGLLAGAFLTVAGFLLCTPMLRMMDTPESVIGLSSVYMKIYFLGMIPSMFYNFGAAILRAAGDTQSPLYYLTAAGVLNIVLNIFFVTVFDMNVAGVALATILSQTLSAVLVLRALMKRPDSCRLIPKEMKIRKPFLLKILRIGLPAGIQSTIFSISNVMIQSSVNSLGETVLAGSAAAANIEGFTYTSITSFSHTAMNFAGQNTGARQYKRVKTTYFLCMIQCVILGILLGSLTCLFGKQLLGIYITDSPEAIAAGIKRIYAICQLYFICGIMDISTGLLRGMGYALLPLFMTVIGVCGFRITWILTVFRNVPEVHTLFGLCISYPISWAATFAVELLTFFLLYRKLTHTVPDLPAAPRKHNPFPPHAEIDRQNALAAEEKN